MTTCGDLISEISAQLHGWGITNDRVTPLTVGINDTDLALTVDFTFSQAAGITPGVVEIDSEQLFVTSIDTSTGVCTLANGFGRGFKGTTAAAHSAGAMVISRPKFPRIWLLSQVNRLIDSVYPQLFAVNTHTATVTWPDNSYTLPTRPALLLDAQWQDYLGRWRPCRSYKFDAFDGDFRLAGDIPIGRPLRIVYGTRPTRFTSEADNFTVCGLPPSAFDVLASGVVARVLPGLDISRAQASSVEASDRSRVVPPNAGLNPAKHLEAKFSQRLADEARALRKQYPPRIVKV